MHPLILQGSFGHYYYIVSTVHPYVLIFIPLPLEGIERMRLQQPKQGDFQYAHTHDDAWMSQNTNHIHT